MTIIFFGSSEFSLAALNACLNSNHKVIQVITTPDQPQGRGLQLMPTPVKRFSMDRKIPFLAPETLKDPALLEQIINLNPDFYVVSSYGKLIPANWLSVPKQLSLNVHPSLLPKYRGASPIQWPILNGDRETGMSIIEVANKLDAGDIFYQKRVPITDQVNALQLSELLAKESEIALDAVFRDHANQVLKRTPQDESKSTYAPKLKKEDGKIDWNRTALQIHNQIRALHPWPIAFTLLKGEILQMIESRPLQGNEDSSTPGTFIGIFETCLRIKTGEGSVLIKTLKPSGKKVMPAVDFNNGRRLTPGIQFGTP